MTSGLLAASPFGEMLWYCSSGVRQIQKLAEGTGNRQQFVVRQILQRGQQLLAVSFVAGA